MAWFLPWFLLSVLVFALSLLGVSLCVAADRAVEEMEEASARPVARKEVVP